MKFLLFLIFLLPLIYAILELFVLQTASDPIKYIYTITGSSAIAILFLSITISLWFKKFTKYRKMIGLFGFFYALLHMINFIILDMELNIQDVVSETIDKPFVYLGVISLVLLIFMASTSTKKLFKKYNKYHKVIYIALLLSTIHFVMAQKSISIVQYVYLSAIILIFIFKIKQKFIK